MADFPLRLDILKRLVALLELTEGLDQAGVPFDLTGKVFRGRTEFGDEQLLPALSILEAPTPDIGTFAGAFEARNSSWVLLLQGWAKDDKLNPSDPAYYLQAAVESQLAKVNAKSANGLRRALYPEFYLLGDTITQLEIGPPVVRPLDKSTSSRAFFYQPIRVGIAEYVGEPYRSA